MRRRALAFSMFARVFAWSFWFTQPVTNQAVAPGPKNIPLDVALAAARGSSGSDWSPDWEISYAKLQFCGEDRLDNSQWFERRGRLDGFGLPLWCDGAISSFESRERATRNRDGRGSL